MHSLKKRGSEPKIPKEIEGKAIFWPKMSVIEQILVLPRSAAALLSVVKIIFCQNLWRANEIMEDLEYEQPRNSRWVSVADYYLSFSLCGLVYQKELFNNTSLLVDGKNIVSRIAIRKTCCHLNIRGPTPLQELFVFWLLCRCLSQSPRQYNGSPTILLLQLRG